MQVLAKSKNASLTKRGDFYFYESTNYSTYMDSFLQMLIFLYRRAPEELWKNIEIERSSEEFKELEFFIQSLRGIRVR